MKRFSILIEMKCFEFYVVFNCFWDEYLWEKYNLYC